MIAARSKLIAFVAAAIASLFALTWSPSAYAGDRDLSRGEDVWGRWTPADEGFLPMDVRVGLHVGRLSLGGSAVGGGKRGLDYGFRRPTVYVPEITVSAFTSKHLAVGLLLQPAAFGAQDAPVPPTSTPTVFAGAPQHTRSPFVLGTGLVAEGPWSLGPVMLRPGVATGLRAVMLIEDRSGKQSPPAVVQWFIQARGSVEIELSRSAAIGAGGSVDVMRPTDWGVFSYLSWRFNDVGGAT